MYTIEPAMKTRTLALHELNRHAIASLISEIGVAGTLRFLGRYSMGSGDYTVEREALLEDLNKMSIEELAEQASCVDEGQNG